MTATGTPKRAPSGPSCTAPTTRRPAGDGGSAMTSARARINISTLDYVRASLAPLHSCYEQRLVGVAVAGSWIEFENFGTAAQPSESHSAGSA